MSQHSSQSVEFIFDYIEEPVELVEKAKSSLGVPIRRALIDAMTTRETFFFRYNSPVDALRLKALPETLDIKWKQKSNKLRIWSAAASTGQEACSIGMIISEMVPDLHRWDIQILATDISEDASAKARRKNQSRQPDNPYH